MENENPKQPDIEKALLQERYLMSALMDNVPDHIYFKDLESRFIRNNIAHARSFGFDHPDSLKGKSDFDFFVKDIAQELYDDEQEIIRTGNSINKEECTIRSDNSVNWYQTTKMPLRDVAGNIVGTFGISRDITVRKRAEDELRKHALAVEQSPVSIVITNVDGDIEYANPKACETTGYSLEELYGKNPRVLKSGETQADEYTFLWKSITSGQQWTGIFHNKRKNGELYWESSTIGPIKDADGKITHYLAIKEDITERRLIDKALRESESRLRSFFDLPLIGHAMISPSKEWLEVNESLCKMLGFTKDELLCMTWSEITSPEDIEADLDQFNQVITGLLDGYTLETRFRHKEGHLVATHVAIQCMRHVDNSVNYFMAVIVDISDRKKVEEEVKMKNIEMVRTNAEKDKFFSIVAHDLRSPFNAFLNITKIMAEEAQEMSLNQIQKLATSMNKSAATLFELLENLLEWSRIQRGLTEYTPEKIDLKEKVQKLLQVFSDLAISKHITLKEEIPDNLKVLADEMMLESTLRNLLSNALKFTGKGGEVMVTAELSKNKTIIVSVRDTGIGMNSKILCKLFRIDENVSRKGTDGESSSGLGLLLCKEFIEKNGGKIWVDSTENVGTTFYFTLPVQ